MYAKNKKKLFYFEINEIDENIKISLDFYANKSSYPF